jgi:hypothetical protein
MAAWVASLEALTILVRDSKFLNSIYITKRLYLLLRLLYCQISLQKPSYGFGVYDMCNRGRDAEDLYATAYGAAEAAVLILLKKAPPSAPFDFKKSTLVPSLSIALSCQIS